MKTIERTFLAHFEIFPKKFLTTKLHLYIITSSAQTKTQGNANHTNDTIKNKGSFTFHGFQNFPQRFSHVLFAP